MEDKNVVPLTPDFSLVKLASKAAIGAASVMVLAKFYAWFQTGSLSLQASLVDSMLDILASILNFIIIRQAIKPADKEHRFGHGKAEAIGGLVQTAFIAGSAAWLIIDVAHRLFEPQPLSHVVLGNSVMVAATIITGALIVFQRYVVKRTKSLAIKADSVHYETDFLTNIGVLISLNLSVYFGWLWLDVVVGGVIAVYIFVASLKIALSSVDVLMDKELDNETRIAIKKIISCHPRIHGFHDLRTRSSGYHMFVQFHLDLDKNLPLWEAHQIGEEVEQMIIEKFPTAEVIIHHDAYSQPNIN
ncbi:cation diffusion facilitator family transporter [Candidatus Odyssella acanthamoebae]|uniref:cation diffusion facilitator family transporter n=1 Tax=Candidatus Odyssella acanthamoebae TaxID=91604 RepID=UPI000690A823|nr:cation diffusion facilitator family transporter [Candidatus Paracaedibacter acanthamoebae]